MEEKKPDLIIKTELENEDEIFLGSLVTNDVMPGEYSIKNTMKVGLPFGAGGYDLFVTNKRFFVRKKSIGVGIPIGFGWLEVDLSRKNLSFESLVDTTKYIAQKLKLTNNPPIDYKTLNAGIINKLSKESEIIVENSDVKHIILENPKFNFWKSFIEKQPQPNFKIELKSGKTYPFIVPGLIDYSSIRDFFLKYYATIFIEKNDKLNRYYP